MIFSDCIYTNRLHLYFLGIEDSSEFYRSYFSKHECLVNEKIHDKALDVNSWDKQYANSFFTAVGSELERLGYKYGQRVYWAEDVVREHINMIMNISSASVIPLSVRVERCAYSLPRMT
jgi:hypothetical protein